MSKIFINSNNAAEPIADMGVEIPANGQLIIDPSQYAKLVSSDDAILALSLSHITYSDGTNALSISDAVNHIKGFFPTEIKTSSVPALSDPGMYHFRGTRIVNGTILANESVKVFEYIMAETLSITGVIIKGFNTHAFDWVTLAVVIPVGHPHNPGTEEIIAETFAPSWGVSNDLQILDIYKATVYVGFKIRITYNTQATNDVDFWINAFLHKVVTP